MVEAQFNFIAGMPRVMSKASQSNDDDLLAAEYVLGTLSAAERSAFVIRLNQSAKLRRQVSDWEAKLSPLNADYTAAQPPVALKSAIEKRLFGVNEKPSLIASLSFWRGLSFAALAALALVFAMPYFKSPLTQINAVAQLTLQNGSGTQLVVYLDEANKSLRFNRLTEQSATGRDFELWLIVGKDAPQSLGVLPAVKSGEIKISSALMSKIANATLAISDEPQGGSPTGLPTGAILSVGQLTAL